MPFPREETYSLTDQIRRSSRSVCSNLAEAWRKQRYEGAFISKLSDAEGEAAELLPMGSVASGAAPGCATARLEYVTGLKRASASGPRLCARAGPVVRAAGPARSDEAECEAAQLRRSRTVGRVEVCAEFVVVHCGVP